MKPSLQRLTRRALLTAGAGLSVAPAIEWASRERLPLFTQHRVPSSFLAALVDQLDAAFTAAGRATRVVPVIAKSHAQLESLAKLASRDALVFAGAGWADAWRRALPSSVRSWRLSFGAEVDSSAAHVAGPLWQAVELGGAWSGRQLGRRAAVLVSPEQAATDLPLAFQHGLQRSGGEVVKVVVASAHRAADAWALVRAARPEVVAVLASADSAAQLWSHAPAGLPTFTHAFSGGEGRSHVAREATPALEALAQRTVAQLLGQRTSPPRLELSTPSGRTVALGSPDTATLCASDELALRNRSTSPFTGC